MDFHTAVEQAISLIEAGTEPDSDSVRAGLALAVHVWQTCNPQPGMATSWAMFGNGLCAAIDELRPPPQPYVVLGDLPIPDTSQVRHQVAELTTAIAAQLDAAASDPRHDGVQRWSWATAAARLRTAGRDLMDWP